MTKQEYVAPEGEVLELGGQMNLLATMSTGVPDAYEEGDPDTFGENIQQ